MPFKYTSSLPLCQLGNILQENKKDLSLQHYISIKKAAKSLANFTKQNKKRLFFQIPNTRYFGHHLALCKLKEVGMLLITISRFLVVGIFFEKQGECSHFFSFLSIINPQSGKRQEGWRPSSLLWCNQYYRWHCVP